MLNILMYPKWQFQEEYILKILNDNFKKNTIFWDVRQCHTNVSGEFTLAYLESHLLQPQGGQSMFY